MLPRVGGYLNHFAAATQQMGHVLRMTLSSGARRAIHDRCNLAARRGGHDGRDLEEAAMTGKPVIDKFLHAIETANIPGCDAWSADATLDATVPSWRLHADGADAIRAEYARWFADPARFDELRRYPVEGGSAEVVEYTLSWTENGAPHAGHPHVLTVRDDRIVSDMVFCGGRWPAALLAEMEAAGA
jgi:hypothetical protein